MNLEERRAIVHSDVLVGKRRAIQHWQTASRSLRFHRLVPIVVFADACRYRFTMVICERMAILAENSAYLSTGWWDASVAEERMPRSKLIRSQITRNLESCPDFQFRLTFIRKCEMRGLHPDDGRNHIYPFNSSLAPASSLPPITTRYNPLPPCPPTYTLYPLVHAQSVPSEITDQTTSRCRDSSSENWQRDGLCIGELVLQAASR